MRRLGWARIGLGIAFALVVMGASPCEAGDSKVTAATQIWHVVDTATGATYYAQSVQAGWFAVGSGMFSASGNGTVVYTPIQAPGASHIASEDSWRTGDTVPGALASWKGEQSGWAAITADGAQHNPSPPSGKGYTNVKFRDLKTKKMVSISKFTADKVRAGDVEGLLPKKR